MEELVRAQRDEELRGEMFICGVFSLLDGCSISRSRAARLAAGSATGLRGAGRQRGQYQPYVELVRAIENESLFEFRESAEKLMMSVSEINRAELRALMAASELE